MGIFCKVCLSVGEGHDKEQLCVIGGVRHYSEELFPVDLEDLTALP